MSKPKILADADHALVRETTERLTIGRESVREKLEAIFYYVREEIRFGFPAAGDLVRASETIRLGYGQCNTKGTLFLALTRATGVPARIHFSAIRKEIQRGLFPDFAFRMMPDEISHSWVEVEVEGRWRRLDTYINDLDFYLAGKQALKANDWKTGFSVSCAKSASSADFNLDEDKFVQMDAVTEDHGVWDEPADYYQSPNYRNRPGFLKLLVYRLIVGRVNARVAKMRAGCSGGLCGVEYAVNVGK